MKASPVLNILTEHSFDVAVSPVQSVTTTKYFELPTLFVSITKDLSVAPSIATPFSILLLVLNHWYVCSNPVVSTEIVSSSNRYP